MYQTSANRFLFVCYRIVATFSFAFILFDIFFNISCACWGYFRFRMHWQWFMNKKSSQNSCCWISFLFYCFFCLFHFDKCKKIMRKKRTKYKKKTKYKKGRPISAANIVMMTEQKDIFQPAHKPIWGSCFYISSANSPSNYRKCVFDSDGLNIGRLVTMVIVCLHSPCIFQPVAIKTQVESTDIYIFVSVTVFMRPMKKGENHTEWTLILCG